MKDNQQIKSARPEFVRLPVSGQKEYFTGLGRSKLWQILQTGKVESISLKTEGQTRGARLIRLEGHHGLLTYLDSLPREFVPCSTDE
jgi:hypothetical protein